MKKVMDIRHVEFQNVINTDIYELDAPFCCAALNAIFAVLTLIIFLVSSPGYLLPKSINDKSNILR